MRERETERANWDATVDFTDYEMIYISARIYIIQIEMAILQSTLAQLIVHRSKPTERGNPRV